MNPCTQLLKSLVKPDYTACSYAFMVDGKIVASDAIGVIDKINNQPITTDCTFNVCSISKIYCTVLMMQLIDEGLVNLDDPIIKYLPEFKMKDERYKDITIHMCLDHTSGLPGTQWKHFSVNTTNKFDYYQEVLDYLSNSTLKADPGIYSAYCNDGFTLAEMIIVKVRQKPYEVVLKECITDKISAYSTNSSYSINEKYPLVSEGKKPKEYFPIQGAGGLTTNMEDLCRFGQIFLEPNKILSEQSKKLMAKSWGKTFLKQDKGAIDFGLGWDLVTNHDPEFDFGEGVLSKGGNSMFFSSRLIIIPKYNAVLALSETHDCGLDVPSTLMRLFKVYLNQNTYPDYSGIYIYAFGMMKITCVKEYLIVQEKNNKGWTCTNIYHFKDGIWFDNKSDAIQFEERNDEIYLIKTIKGRTLPFAMKAHPQTLSNAWKERMNKKYIVCNTTEFDLTINQLMCSVEFKETENILSILLHSNIEDGFSDGLNEFPIEIVDDNHAQSHMNTPCNGSRDRVEPYFENGKLYLNTYIYICEDDLEEYQNQNKGVFKINHEIKQLPSAKRVMILNTDGNLIFDTMETKEYTPVKNGFIVLV